MKILRYLGNAYILWRKYEKVRNIGIFQGWWLASIFGGSFTGIFTGIFTSDQQKFRKSELSHVPKAYWWDNEDHKTAVIACLVKATYVLETDRRRPISYSRKIFGRLFRSESTTTHLADPWYKNFGFKLLTPLVDTDLEIFGAVYEYEHPEQRNDIPLYVIAFRGSITKKDKQKSCRVIMNELHGAKRSEKAIEYVREIISTKSTVWLAGHSLGASMTMLVGKCMATMENGAFLESYLFNPPFPSVTTKQIDNDIVKLGLRTCKNFVTAGLATVANMIHTEDNSSPFVALKDWIPHLFVNKSDTICSEYIGYFGQRGVMDNFGLGGIGRVATQYSTWGAFWGVFWKDYPESLHRIPSANLSLNLNPSKNILEDHHALSQWWRSDLMLDSTLYQ